MANPIFHPKLFPGQPWPSDFTSMSLSYLLCKMNLASTLQDGHENQTEGAYKMLTLCKMLKMPALP